MGASPGDRVAIGTMMIEVGALAETVVVTGDAPIIQAQTGARSFTLSTEAVGTFRRPPGTPATGRVGSRHRCSSQKDWNRILIVWTLSGLESGGRNLIFVAVGSFPDKDGKRVYI